MDLTSSNIGQFLSLQLWTATANLIGTNFANVKVEGIFNYKTASRYANVAQLHATVYPTLPSGTPNDYTAYNYALLLLPDGVTEVVIGLPWIDPSSVEVSGAITYQALIYNCTSEDFNLIRNALIANGKTQFSLAPFNG